MTNTDKLENIMGIVRTFVCNVPPNSERYLSLTYQDASILASEVANLRITLAIAENDRLRAVQQRDDLHTFFMAVSEKLAMIDPLWNQHKANATRNMELTIDALLRSAGVLRDEPVGCPSCDEKWEYCEDLQEQIALHREQAREVTIQAKDALERVLPQAQGALVIADIQNSLTAIKGYLENIP